MKKLYKKRCEMILSDLPDYRRYFLKLFLILIVGLVGILSAYQFLWKPHFELALNETESLPQTLFLVVKGQRVTRGDYVAFYPPQNPLYGNKTPFLKIVGGVYGDVVTHRGHESFVDGYDMGHIYNKATDGNKLFPGQTGVIGKNEYYVYTNHPKSYDSRYKSIGWIQKKHIVGRAYPIF